jgi:hypothetical protein
MVRVNGKKFKIYELDSIQSFKSRVAATMNTLEHYLYFTNDVTDIELRNKKSNIIVEDLLSEIKNSSKKSTSVVDLFTDIQSKVGKIKYDKGKDIIKLWLSYNKNLKKDVNIQGKLPLDTIGKDLEAKKIYLTKNIIHSVWKETNSFKKYNDDRIEANKEAVRKTIELFNEYDKIEESSAYTDFEIEHINFIITLEQKDLSLLELFNSIHLNSNVPFCTTKNFYKILQDFIPPEEWTESSEEHIILQVNQKTNITNYETTRVKVDPVSRNTLIEITINTAKNNITRDVFTERTLSVFKEIDVNIKQIDESKVIGVFYFPVLRLNKYIFADLVMNDPIFSRLIKIDDHEKATKIKPGIYIHFEHPSTGYINATLTEKNMIKGDPTMKNVDLDFFEPGSPFIRVKVSKANNTKAVDIFKEILGKLFIRYAEKEDNIITYYKNYIPNFGDIAPPEVVEKPVLKHSDVAPELFVTNYTRNCKPDRMTTIISEEDAIQAQADGRSVLKFPRDIPEDPDAFKFPMDGEKQNYYVCNNPEFTYVGIKNNKLKNADIYPYVPCCYKINQKNKPKFMHYYESKELVTGEKKQHNIIKTDKILKHDQFGTLPLNLENLFVIIDPNPKYEYVRKGVHSGKNSFINVVMEALNDETKILEVYGEHGIEKVLEDERLALAKESIVPLCRQELYDRSINEIINMLKNPEVYFDPRLFVHLLEDRFDCNIFLFSRKYLDGEMILPRHLQAYYKNRSKKRCVYIYEHMGSESDHAKYPQCELIIKYNTKKSTNNVQYSFTYEEARNIRNMYGRLRKAYALNNVIKETYMPINPDVKIKSQWIDSYGKTRRLNIYYQGKNITIITSPIQPIKVRESTNKKIYLTDIDIAMKLIETLEIQITSQTVIGDITKEINGTLGNVTVSIPLDTKDKIFGVTEKEYGLSFPEKHSSALQQYNMNKKIARYLVEYTLWTYSTYLNVNSIVDITDNNIANFSRDFFIVKPDYKYGHIEKTLTLDSPILDSGKIVVRDEETIKRLIYVLRLSSHMNVDSIKHYHERTVISKYYMDITDFVKYDGQVILYGEESVNKWIFENNVPYNLYDEVKIGVNTPYFFKNLNIDNNVYLAQNTQNLEKASDIAISWVRNGYNVGIYAENKPPISFTLYSYRNSNTISKGIPIKGKPFSIDVKILGYKIEEEPEYTVLLPLY